MNKSFILLVCLFGLSFLFQGSQGQTATAAAPRQCEIGYYDVPQPPVCTTEIGADGKPEQVCTAVGSAAFAANLDKNMKSFPVKSFPLNDIEWSGYCRCTLYLYSQPNYKGYSLSYPFSKNTAKHIYVNKIWRRTAKSFKVSCTF